MAVIHKSRSGRRKRLWAAGVMMILGWPLAVLTTGLSVYFYVDSAWLPELAEKWRLAFGAWAAVGPADEAAQAAWRDNLARVLAVLQHGMGWGIYGLVLALPGLLGLAMSILFAAGACSARRRYGLLRAQVRGDRAALKLLSQLPDSCHVFVHRRICFDGGTADPDVIVVGPGGTAVIDVKSWTGLIEGCVTDAVLYRRREDGSVDKLRNPARLVVGHVTRLSNYLRSVGVNAGVVPCVLFVDPRASVYVGVPEELIISERRTHISHCVMADTTTFWELLGRGLMNGHQQNRSAVERQVAAIRRAPRGRGRPE